MFPYSSQGSKLLPLILLLIFFCETVFSQPPQNDPDPSRFHEEIALFRKWDQKNSFPKNPILFTGSSSARLWQTAKAFPGYPIINRGFGGSHISDVQFYYEDIIAPYNPSVVILYAGDNDIASGKAPKRVLADFRQLSETIYDDFPDVHILYISIKPSSSRWDMWPQMEEANKRIKKLTEAHEHLFYVDLATPLLGTDGKPNDFLFMEDLLHLNEQGYAAWNETIAPVLKTIWNKNN